MAVVGRAAYIGTKAAREYKLRLMGDISQDRQSEIFRGFEKPHSSYCSRWSDGLVYFVVDDDLEVEISLTENSKSIERLVGPMKFDKTTYV